MGLEHGGAHDKVSMAQWSPIEVQLLSTCFCRACEGALANLGIDPVALARTIREGLARGVTSMEEALGEVSPAVARYRGSLSTTLQSDLLDAAHEVDPAATLTLHASANPWATGSFPSTSHEVLTRATCAVANCWTAQSVEDTLHELGALTSNLGAYLRLDHQWDRVDEDLARYATLGVRELHLYHLGLMSQASADAAARIVSGWTSRVGAANMDDVEESLNDR